jgi:hypothetical protein
VTRLAERLVEAHHVDAAEFMHLSLAHFDHLGRINTVRLSLSFQRHIPLA